MKQLKAFQRHLELEGCYNLRELGGYQTYDGQQIDWRTLLRGDSLHRLPTSSQQKLLEYGVKSIIDLRSSSEVNREQYAFSRTSEVTYLNLPLVEDKHQIQLLKKKSLLEHNRFFLEERSQAIKIILETIATQKSAVIIHCSAGKDRTGIIIALLLAIANVSVVTIAEDYQLSGRYLAPLYPKIYKRAMKEGFTHLLESSPQTIIDTFSFLDHKYGGVNNYLDKIAINLETRNHLKNMLVQSNIL